MPPTGSPSAFAVAVGTARRAVARTPFSSGADMHRIRAPAAQRSRRRLARHALAAARGAVEAPAARARLGARPQPHGRRLAPELDAGARREVADRLAHERARLLGDEDIVAGHARRLLDPRRGVDGVADHREVEATAAADRAGEHDARVDADADLQLVAVLAAHALGDLDRRGERAVGMVGM